MKFRCILWNMHGRPHAGWGKSRRSPPPPIPRIFFLLYWGPFCHLFSIWWPFCYVFLIMEGFFHYVGATFFYMVGAFFGLAPPLHPNKIFCERPCMKWRTKDGQLNPYTEKWVYLGNTGVTSNSTERSLIDSVYTILTIYTNNLISKFYL